VNPDTSADSGQPSGPRPGARPNIVVAKTVAPSRTDSSEVIAPDHTDRVQIGAAPLTDLETHVFKTVKLGDGSTKDFHIDIQGPATPGLKPAIIYVTGGGFLFVRKENALELRTFIAERGYVVASIEYRVIPDGADYRDGVVDVQDAVRYLRRHGQRFQIDADRIGLWGESAGGYLVAAAATMPPAADAESRVSSAVQAVVDKFGASDLADLGADFDAQTRALYKSAGFLAAQWLHGPGTGQAADADPEAARRANPATYVSAETPPFLIFHGSDDRIMSPSQTLALHDRIREVGGRSTRYVVAGAGHGDIAVTDDPGVIAVWYTNEVMNIIGRFFDTYLRPVTPTSDGQ
jgi:acetyl esterase/lipase